MKRKHVAKLLLKSHQILEVVRQTHRRKKRHHFIVFMKAYTITNEIYKIDNNVPQFSTRYTANLLYLKRRTEQETLPYLTKQKETVQNSTE